MEQLLQALRDGDSEKIKALAHNLFITSRGRWDLGQVNEFEHYGPCRIILPQNQTQNFGGTIGQINYNGQIYYF